jgi:hypothetical protein
MESSNHRVDRTGQIVTIPSPHSFDHSHIHPHNLPRSKYPLISFPTHLIQASQIPPQLSDEFDVISEFRVKGGIDPIIITKSLTPLFLSLFPLGARTIILILMIDSVSFGLLLEHIG